MKQFTLDLDKSQQRPIVMLQTGLKALLDTGAYIPVWPRLIPAWASSHQEIPAGNTPRQAINAVFRKNLDFSS